jgi:hypothetical protein
MSSPPDRASVVAGAIIQTITDALRQWAANGDLTGLADVHATIVATLRDELFDAARMARDETRLNDD